MKTSVDRADARLLAGAVGCSLLIHAAAIGGWVWWEAGHDTGTFGSHSSREIPVTIQPSPKAESKAGSAHLSAPASQEHSAAAASVAPVVAPHKTPGHAITARQALEDPATGLVFAAYFKSVKGRLAQTAQATSYALGRDLWVRFELSRTGVVLSVTTPPDTPRADRDIARLLLQAAAPFPPFPEAVPHASIVFDVHFRADKNMLV